MTTVNSLTLEETDGRKTLKVVFTHNNVEKTLMEPVTTNNPFELANRLQTMAKRIRDDLTQQ